MSKSTNVIFTFLIFAKKRPVRTKVIYTQTERQTDTHTHTNTETDKLIAMGELLHVA